MRWTVKLLADWLMYLLCWDWPMLTTWNYSQLKFQTSSRVDLHWKFCLLCLARFQIEIKFQIFSYLIRMIIGYFPAHIIVWDNEFSMIHLNSDWEFMLPSILMRWIVTYSTVEQPMPLNDLKFFIHSALIYIEQKNCFMFIENRKQSSWIQSTKL